MNKNIEPLHIVATNLVDYSFKVQQAVQEGWEFSTKQEYFPKMVSFAFEAWMIKDKINSKVSTSPSNELSNAPLGDGSQKENKPLVAPSKGVSEEVKKTTRSKRKE